MNTTRYNHEDAPPTVDHVHLRPELTQGFYIFMTYALLRDEGKPPIRSMLVNNKEHHRAFKTRIRSQFN